jgi:hypothetical protein
VKQSENNRQFCLVDLGGIHIVLPRGRQREDPDVGCDDWRMGQYSACPLEIGFATGPDTPSTRSVPRRLAEDCFFNVRLFRERTGEMQWNHRIGHIVMLCFEIPH